MRVETGVVAAFRCVGVAQHLALGYGDDGRVRFSQLPNQALRGVGVHTTGPPSEPVPSPAVSRKQRASRGLLLTGSFVSPSTCPRLRLGRWP